MDKEKKYQMCAGVCPLSALVTMGILLEPDMEQILFVQVGSDFPSKLKPTTDWKPTLLLKEPYQYLSTSTLNKHICNSI